MDKKIALYTFFDDGFFEYGFTMLYSFIVNNLWFNGDIFILSDNGENCCLSEEKMKILKKLYKKTYFCKVDLENYTPVFENFKNIDRREFLASFYKIEMFRKDDYDAKFFIDADVCFTGDVQELFGNILENSFVLMCRDIISSSYSSVDILPKTNNDYANMGFLIVNGNLLLEEHYFDLLNGCGHIKPENYTNQYSGRGLYGDQDCLNEFIKKATMIPAQMYDACVINMINEVKIIHYYGAGRKPWNYGDTFYNGFLPWYRYYFWAMKKLKEISDKNEE